MNENTREEKDTQLIIYEIHAALSSEENLSSFSQGQTGFHPHKQGTDLEPSNPLGNTLEKDFEKIPTQEEASGVQVTELLSSSSDEIILSPSLASEQEMKLEKEKKIEKSPFKSKIKRFLASYYEVSTVACLLREKWVLLLSVLICSKMALEIRESEELVPRLFVASYCCLTYQMFENLLHYRFLRTTTNSRNEKADCLFDFADKAIILLFVSISNLNYYKLINEWFMFLPPILFMLAFLMYRKHCLIAQSQDDLKIIAKIFYMLQSFMIALKMTNVLDFQWKITLSFLVVFLSINGLYAILAGLFFIALCLTFFLNFDGQTFWVLRNRILGYIWYIGCSLVNVAGLIILLGFFEKIGSNEDDTFEWGLEIAKNLSFFLVTFSALLFPILKKQDFNLFQDLRTALQDQVTGPKKYAIIKTEEQRREAFFLMISATYFNQLRDLSQTQFEEMMMRKNDIENHAHNKEEERNLCYICENNVSNAILAECGHGGVCCHCALKLVEKKNECMGCRKPVTSIYKIDSNNPAEGIVKAHELVEIIEIEFSTER